MKIIDAHMHFSNIGVFKETAELVSNVDYSYEGFIKECSDCGIQAAICMGLSETEKYLFPDSNAETPMLADLADQAPESMYLCPGVNPYKLNQENIDRLEQVARSHKTVGIKIYAGYYHLDIYNQAYAPVYAIARKYNLPVVLHSGDTYSEKGLLTYSHPLHVDRLAFEYRDINFIIAHIGDPWILDACEVAYKNKNVFIDLSGLIVGDKNEFARVEKSTLLMNRFKIGLELLNDYKKLLFGTDWPLAPMREYIDFCKMLVPKLSYDDVFYNNANSLFELAL